MKRGTGGIEKEVNEILEILLNGLLYGIWRALKRTFRGAMHMRGWQFAGFGAMVLGSMVTYTLRTEYFHWIRKLQAPSWVQKLSLCLLLLLPVWYLLLYGWVQELCQGRYQKEFAAIGFRSRDGKYPYLVKRIREKGGELSGKRSKKSKEVYIFRSNIPVTEWINAKERIETALDRNIIRFSEGKDKKTCRVITVPPECKIPERIDWDESKLQGKDGLMAIGEGALETVQFDLNRTPHVIAAGETGSGKSVILRSLLWQLICKGARVYMIDFKGGVEFGKRYERYGEVITDRKRAVAVLTELCKENEKRLALFRDMEVKNLPEYNRKAQKNLCRIGIFCDEIAEMLDKKGAGKEDRETMEKLEGLISSLARLSRATGINLFLGVQRPDANVLTGQIKNNIPIRICGRFADKSASEIVLGNTDAVYLPEIKGRFLFRLGNTTEEFQAYFFDDDRDMVGKVPVPGDMLLYEKKDGESREGEEPEGAEQQLVEKIQYAGFAKAEREREEKKMRKEAAKAEKRLGRIADKEEPFDFSWSCEKNGEDGS